MNEIDDEQAKRRKRITLYKRIIKLTIVTMIILPTILCVVLFARMNGYRNDLKDLKNTVEQYFSQKEEQPEGTSAVAENSTKEEETKPVNPNPGTEKATKAEPETKTEEPEKIDEKALVEEAVKAGRKVVYLTFDDGPSSNTIKLLDIFDKYNVKVTFFVNGVNSDPNVLKEIVKRGHSLGNHTYSHDYKKVYSGIKSIASELNSLQKAIKKATGTYSMIFRFPGGASKTQTTLPITVFTEYLETKGYQYFDWNVSCGDGEGYVSANDVYNNIMEGIEQNDVSMVLMHDADYRHTTFEAMPRLIEKLQSMNALILPITEDTVPVHHKVK